MKKFSIRPYLFIFYSLALAVSFTYYLGEKDYALNFYILPILYGAYYFSLSGAVVMAVLCSGLTIHFAYRAGFSPTDTQILTQIIIFGIVSGVSGWFQKENNRLNEYFHKASLTDMLTGLYNYGHFNERIKEEIARADRYKRNVALAMIDLDLFKEYNDKFGHEKGNEALIRVGEILKQTCRHADIPFRYGGEEFAVIMPETSEAAKSGAERLRKAVGQTKFPGRQITISVGVSYHPWPHNTRFSLVERADKALYRAKAQGRNQICVYEEGMG